MKKIIFAAIVMLAAPTPPGAKAGKSPSSVLEIADSLHATPILTYPESFETDVKQMQENWYLKNYTDIDTLADSRPTVEVSDEEIIARLQAMPTVIEMPFNSEVRKYINMYADRRKQLVENMLALGTYYMPIFEQSLDRYGLPLELKYLPVIESALNPAAVSRVGATGLWQFMLPTATGEGMEISSLVDERRDPYASSDAAARYLKKLYGIFNDWSLAIAAYNCGPGNINKALRRAGDGKKDFWDIYPYLPAETRGYFPAFIAANYIMTYYPQHNIRPALARRPIVTDTVHVTHRVHFQQIADVMGIPVDELRVLNPQYRADIIPGDIRPYPLVLPSLQAYAYAANEDSVLNHNADKFGRRSVVQPATAAVTGSDAKGEYIEETVTSYHTVKKGETLNSIARKYGVSATSLRKTNNNIRKVRTGQKLKINTVKRTYVDKATASAPVQNAASPDTVTVMVDSVQPDSVVSASMAESVDNLSKAIDKASEAKPAQTKSATKNTSRDTKGTSKNTASAGPKQYKVRQGDNLYKIAKNHGTTVEAIKKANNLKSDALSIDQKLTIPAPAKKK